jgi:hypothetical protein
MQSGMYLQRRTRISVRGSWRSETGLALDYGNAPGPSSLGHPTLSQFRTTDFCVEFSAGLYHPRRNRAVFFRSLPTIL